MIEPFCPYCSTVVEEPDRYCRSCGRSLAAGGDYTESIFATIVESVPTGIFLLDFSGRVRYWNRRMEEYTEMRRRDVLGRSILEAVSYLQPHMRQMMSVFDTALPLRLDQVRHTTEDGAGLTATFWFSPFILEEGAPALLGVMEDITQKVMVDNQLIRSERLAAIGELAAGVAHNFNNVLAAIGGDAQLLKLVAEEEKLPQHVIDAAQQIYDETMRGGRIAHELLSFARGADPHMQRLDLAETVQDVVRLIKNHPSSRGVAIELDVDPALPEVEADEDLLHQVFFNITLNALQAMPGGGILNINAAMREDDEDPNTGMMDVKFHDTGVGIAPQYLKRIFDPFYSRRATGGTGSGLGLPVSLAMVKSIGGDIQVTSVVGIGTTVTVTLPIVERRTIQRGVTRRAPQRRALLVDDDANVRRTLTTLLGRRGFEVVSAGDGEEAVTRFEEALRSRPFDLVLMELMLPRGDGLSATRAIHQLDADAPIVILTGVTDPNQIIEALEGGARFGFSKPPNFNELLFVAECLSATDGT